MRTITISHNSIITRWFLPKSCSTIMLFGMVFTRYSKLDDVCINHEWYHTRQYKDVFSVGLIISILASAITFICDFYPVWWAVGGILLSAVAYYIWYGIEYLVYYTKFNKHYAAMSAHDKACKAISFEKQAHALENDFLSPYKHFSWIKF